MRVKMYSLIVSMILVCTAGSVLATTSVFVSHGWDSSVEQYSQAGTLLNILNVTGFSISKATAPLDQSINDYGPTLNIIVNGYGYNNRVYYFEYDNSFSIGQSKRGWAIANDPTTGILYSFDDGYEIPGDDPSTRGRLHRWSLSTFESSTYIESAPTYQGWKGTWGDVEICGDNVYWTVGEGNTYRNEVFFLMSDN